MLLVIVGTGVMNMICSSVHVSEVFTWDQPEFIERAVENLGFTDAAAGSVFKLKRP